MSFKDILGLKKQVVNTSQNKYVENIIYGHNLFTLKIFDDLVLKYGEQKVNLIFEKKLDRNDFRVMGPSLARDEEVKNFFNMSGGVSETPVFYKEMKLRPFNGRTKHEKFLHFEEFFSREFLEIDYKSFFTFSDDDVFWAKVEKCVLNDFIRDIEKISDIQEFPEANWRVNFSNGVSLYCKNLIWTHSLNMFLKKCNSKNLLKSEFIELCESTDSHAIVYLKLKYTHIISDNLATTVFIPQSFTHDWGHFIGEFKKINDGEEIELISFIDADQTNEEELAKKIKQMKKSLEKVFPNAEKHMNSSSDVITVNEESFAIDIIDMEKVSDIFPEHFLCVNFNSPIDLEKYPEYKNRKMISPMLRAALAYKNIEI